MRRLKALLLIAILAAAACRPATILPSAQLSEDQQAAIVAEVGGALDGLFAAMNAHDADRILEHYANREDLVYVGAMTPEFGHGRLETMVRNWATRRSEVTVSFQVIHVQVVSPDVATAFTQGRFSDREASTVWTHVLVRGTDGIFRIVLEHEVWPGADEPRGPHPM